MNMSSSTFSLNLDSYPSINDSIKCSVKGSNNLSLVSIKDRISEIVKFNNLININKSRNNSNVIIKTLPKILDYNLPIPYWLDKDYCKYPRNASPYERYSYNSRLYFRLRKELLSNPLVWMKKYIRLVLNKPRIFIGPLTRGQNFVLVLRKLYLRYSKYLDYLENMYRKQGRKLYSYPEKPSFSSLDYNLFIEPISTCSGRIGCSNRSTRVDRYERFSKRSKVVPIPDWDYSHPLFKVEERKERSPFLLLLIRLRINMLRQKPQYICKLFRHRRHIINDDNIFKKFSPNFRPISVNNVNNCRIELQGDKGDETPETMPPHGGTAGNQAEASNTVIETQAPVVKAKQVIKRMDWVPFCSSDSVTRAKKLTGRWIDVGHFDWKTDGIHVDKINKGNIAYWDVPIDLMPVNHEDRCNMPNFTLFKVHAYSSFDVHIKFAINSNKFQSGSLMAAFIYQHYNDGYAYMRQNVGTLSQTNHIRLNAGAQNEGELIIPFRHSLSMLYNNRSDRCLWPLNLGRMYVTILAPLVFGKDACDVAPVTMYMKFENLVLTGQRHGALGNNTTEDRLLNNIVLPQMELGAAITMIGAMRLLDTYLPDPNRDNPPLNAEPSYFVPTASHNWAAGTNRVDVNHAMRLDPAGQTHHPKDAWPEDKFTVSNLSRKKGFLKSFKMDLSTQTRGSQIFAIPVEPMFGRLSQTIQLPFEIKQGYCLPPISVLSSMFAYWRGEIEFEFDIICSNYHSGKLMFSYIPNYNTNNITMDRANASPHAIISVEGPKTFNLRVPYVANQRWWPRTATGNFERVSVAAPSTLFCHMSNKFIRKPDVSQYVYINVFVKAAPSFEVAVPVQPSIGLASNSLIYLPDSVYIRPIDPKLNPSVTADMMIAVDITPSVAQPAISKPVLCQMALNVGYVQFYTFLKDKRFEFKNPKDILDNRPCYFIEFNGDFVFVGKRKDWEKKFIINYGCLVPKNDKWYVVIAKNRESAIEIGNLVQYYNKTYDDIPTDYFYDFEKTTIDKNASAESGKFIYNYLFKSSDLDSQTWKLGVLKESYDNRWAVTHQNGEREGVAGPSALVTMTGDSNTKIQPTSFGRMDYGESFDDLTNLCRRYQLYGQLMLYKQMLTQNEKCSFYFTCNPCGLQYKAYLSNDYGTNIMNRIRDGPIPILLSGYRYFRGSLRFRIVFPRMKDTVVWIQHRPDRPSRPETIDTCHDVETAEAVFNHGYASYVQLTEVNNIVEFEVPFYQYDQYGLLQCSNYAGQAFDYQYGLGQVVVGIKCPADEVKNFIDRDIPVYYALADDFSPSVFYGFPPMLFLDDIPDEVRLQADDEFKVCSKVDRPNVTVSVKKVKVESAPIATTSTTPIKSPPTKEDEKELIKEVEAIKQSSWTDKLKPSTWFKSGYKNLHDTIKQDVKEASDGILSQIKEAGSSVYKDLMDNTAKENQAIHISIINLVSNIAHVILNFNLRSVVVSVIAIFSNLGIVIYDKFMKIYNTLKKIIARFFCGSEEKSKLSPEQQKEVEEAAKSTVSEANNSDKTNKDTVRLQGPESQEDEIASWVSCLYGSVFSLHSANQAHKAPPGKKMSEFSKEFNYGMRGSQGVFNFIKNSFSCVKKIYEYIVHKVNPEFALLKSLEGDEGVIQQWIKEAIALIDPFAFDRDCMRPEYVDRVYACYDYGSLFMSRLITSKLHNRYYVKVQNLYKRVTEIRARLVQMGQNPHIRREPFGIYMFGAPGIGKSTIREALAIPMLEHVGYEADSVDLFCTVEASDKHWNQCRGQPVLVFDDLWNIQAGEILYQQISYIFRVFSNTVLCPPKAALDEKDMRYNPEIVWMSSNYGGLINIPGIDQDAVNRRRNILIEAVAWKPKSIDEGVEGCPHCYGQTELDKVPAKYLKDFHHMRFYTFYNRLKFDTLDRDPEPLTFIQLKERLFRDFKIFRDNEILRYKQRIDWYNDTFTLPTSRYTDTDVSDGETFAEQYIQSLHKINARIKQEEEEWKNSLVGALVESGRSYYSTIKDKLNPYFTKCYIPNFLHSTASCTDPKCKFYKVVVPQAGDWTPPPREDFETDDMYNRRCTVLRREAEKVAAGYDNACIESFKVKLKRNLFSKFDPKVFEMPPDDKATISGKCKIAENLIGELLSYTNISCKQLEKELQLKIKQKSLPITEDTLDFIIFYLSNCEPKLFVNYRKTRKISSLFDYIQYAFHNSNCLHVNTKFNETSLVDGKIVKSEFDFGTRGNIDIDLCARCSTDYCLLKEPNFERLWYYAWLEYSPDHRYALRQGANHIMPPYFRKEFEYSEIYCVFQTIKDKLSIIWTEYLKPAFKWLFNFFANWYPILLCGIYGMMTLFCGSALRESVSIEAKRNELMSERTEVLKSFKWNEAQGNAYHPGISANRSNAPSMTKLQGAQQVDVVVNRLRRNIFFLTMTNKLNGSLKNYRCIGLSGSVAIGLRHYFEDIRYHIDSGKQVEFSISFMSKVGSEYEMKNLPVNIKDILISCLNGNCGGNNKFNAPETNITVFKVPYFMPSFPNLLKFIAHRHEIERCSAEAMIVFGNTDCRPITLKRRPTNNAPGQYVPEYVSENCYAGHVYLPEWWEYGVQKNGYCGSLIISSNLERPIVGLHVGGNLNADYGIGEILYSEIFRDVSYLIEQKFVDIEMDPLNSEPPSKSNVTLQGPLLGLGYVNNIDKQSQPSRTSVIKTTIHGIYPVTTSPAPLSPNDKRLPKGSHPLRDGVEKHGITVDDFDEKVRDRVCKNVSAHVISYSPPVTINPRMLTEEEAICGDCYIPELGPLDFSTSAGYPLKRFKPVNAGGKKFLFDLILTNDGYKLKGVHPKLREKLDYDRKLRYNKIKPFTVFSDCLKDAVIPTEKCSIPGKTRIFSISPVQYTIEFRRYFGHYLAAVRRHRIENLSAIGINPDSIEWTKLASKLLEVGDNIICGDYSNFGPGLNKALARQMLGIGIEWNRIHLYKEGKMTLEDLNVCEILADEYVDRYHLVDNLVYQPPAGAPSGGPATDILNTHVNAGYMRAAWLELTGASLIEFRNHVRDIYYGDDCILSVSDKYIDKFNGVTLGNYFSQFRIKFTDINKTGDLIKCRTLLESDFLKRKFVPHPFLKGHFLAPVAIDSIYSCLNWCKNDSKIGTIENLRAVTDLVFGHGPQFYNKFLLELADLVYSYHIPFIYLDWSELNDRNFNLS